MGVWLGVLLFFEDVSVQVATPLFPPLLWRVRELEELVAMRYRYVLIGWFTVRCERELDSGKYGRLISGIIGTKGELERGPPFSPPHSHQTYHNSPTLWNSYVGCATLKWINTNV